MLDTEGALDLTIMKEPQKRVESTKLMYGLLGILYLANAPRFPLVIIRHIEYTIKYGVTLHAPPLFASACALLTGPLNDLQGGALYATFALKLLDVVQ